MTGDDPRTDLVGGDAADRVRRLVWADPAGEPAVSSLLPGREADQPLLPLVVLVPVLDRPQSVAPLVESFDCSGTPGRLLFIVNPDDTAELQAVTEASLAHDFVGYYTTVGVSWPEKINVGFAYARQIADWVLFCADDVTFHEGWWDQTAALRAQPEINVIGTNDLGNPAVMSGDHATHPLVRSSYIGTVDNPNEIVHSGYAHWYVDNEFVVTAKIRGCWAPCVSAVVEHNHPYWHKGVWDKTYEKGEENAVADQKTWESRVRLLQKLDKELNG